LLPFFIPFIYIFFNTFNDLFHFVFMSKDAKARGDADTFEVSYDRLELGKQIGNGQFGRVFVARAEAILGIRGYSTVAVKKLKRECYDYTNHIST
jgi:hypothetical protein